MAPHPVDGLYGQILSLVLVLGHFALPFLLLLSADLKKKPRLLAWVALWVLAMRWMDFFWQVAPSVREGGIALHWLDPVVPIAFDAREEELARARPPARRHPDRVLGHDAEVHRLGVDAYQLKKRNVVPAREPALKEILAHG